MYALHAVFHVLPCLCVQNELPPRLVAVTRPPLENKYDVHQLSKMSKSRLLTHAPLGTKPSAGEKVGQTTSVE